MNFQLFKKHKAIPKQPHEFSFPKIYFSDLKLVGKLIQNSILEEDDKQPAFVYFKELIDDEEQIEKIKSYLKSKGFDDKETDQVVIIVQRLQLEEYRKSWREKYRGHVRRFFKGLLLIFWIFTLSYHAYVTLVDKTVNQKKQDLIRRYLDTTFFTYPPVKVMIDAMVDEKTFATVNNLKNDEAYWKLLEAEIVKKMRSLAVNQAIDLNEIKLKLRYFISTLKKDEGGLEVALPYEVKTWIENERTKLGIIIKEIELIDAFYILIIIGAFGGLIFLTKDFLDVNKQTTIRAYFFRPVFGSLLAAATFIADIGTHSIISSSSSLTDINLRPLYFLALVAGLLSDQVYKKIADQAGNTLKKQQSQKT